MTTMQDEPVQIELSEGDDLGHYYCPCNEDIAICGTDISDAPFDDFEELDEDICIVCVDLRHVPCKRCGWDGYYD